MESVGASTQQPLRGKKKRERERKELQRHQYASDKALQNTINQPCRRQPATFTTFNTCSC